MNSERKPDVIVETLSTVAVTAQPGGRDSAEKTGGSVGDRAGTPLVVTEALLVNQPPAVQSAHPSIKPERPQITISPNLTDLVAGRLETLEDQQAFARRRNLNEVVHGVLLFGLAASTILMLVGLGLDLLRHRDVPTAVPGLAETFRRVAVARPSGFLTLGLLVLIATPVFRVIGSIFAFLYERDWRYAAITFLVLLVVSLSVFLGQG